MNVVYAKTAAGPVILHCRPDQDYTGLADIEECLNREATRCSTTVLAYAVADREIVFAECPTSEDLNSKVDVALKSDVPGGATIVPPAGVILADIPSNAYVVYLS